MTGQPKRLIRDGFIVCTLLALVAFVAPRMVARLGDLDVSATAGFLFVVPMGGYLIVAIGLGIVTAIHFERLEALYRCLGVLPICVFAVGSGLMKAFLRVN